MTTAASMTQAREPHAPSGRRAALLVAVLAVVAHAGFVGAAGVWNFELLNYDDPQVVALARDTSAGDIIRGPVWYAYKPVYILSLKFDTLFGDVPSGFAHVHNLLLHGLATFLLVILLARLLRSVWIGAAAGVLFALHPAHVESVAWVAGRKDVLSLVFVLLAHLAYRGSRESGRVSWGAPVLLALGGLTKGTVWVWAAVLVLDEWVERVWAAREGRSFSWSRAIVRLAPCLVVAGGGVVLDALVARSHGPGAVEHGVGIASLAAASAGVFARYVGHLVAPLGLSIDYAVDPAGSWASPVTWLGVALLAGSIFLLVWSLRRMRPAGVLAGGIWLIGLLPFNNLWPQTAVLMADRYLYAPAIGAYVLVAALLATRPRPARVAVLALAGLALLVLTAQRTAVFADSERVWADATEKEPLSALAWIQRGHAVATRGEWKRAATYASKAIDLEPRPELLVRARLLRTDALLGEMGARLALGRRVGDEELRAALAEANRARTLADSLENLPLVKGDPRELRSEAEVLRGKLLESLRDPAAALDAYERAADLFDGNATAHYNLATLMARAGTPEALGESERRLKKALQLRPAFLQASFQLATVLARQGRPADALNALERAERRHGRTPDLLYAQAGVHLEARRDVAKAETLLHEIERVDPDHPNASKLLGEIQIARGRLLLKTGRAERERKKLFAALERFDAAARVREGWAEPDVWAGDTYVLLGRYPEARERYRKALDRAHEAVWLERLLARATILQAAVLARNPESDEDRPEAARLMAMAVSRPVRSIELGSLMALHEELDWLRETAARHEAGGASGAYAGTVLRAAALAVTGDETGARRELHDTFRTDPPAAEDSVVLDTGLLLRARLRSRRSDSEQEREHARRDYRFLVERRPAEPLPRLRLLEQDLQEANVRLATARAGEDPKQVALAQAVAGRATEAIAKLADDHPELCSAVLLAAEAELAGDRPTRALRRLNDLRDQHPKDPRAWRGPAAIYMRQFFNTREPTLRAQAWRALNVARMLDPRDPGTLLTLAQVAWFSGQREQAVSFAEDARALELIDDGPAAEALSGYHVAIGRQALDATDGAKALAEARLGRKVDPGAAAPWILEGDVLLRARERDRAYQAYLRAKELEPLSVAASEGLARVHGEAALVFQLQRAGLKTPRPPQTADPEEREKRTEEWKKRIRWVEAERIRLRRREIRALEAALRHDPEGEKAAEQARRLDDLRGRDPQERRRAALRADEEFQRGRGLYAEKKFVEALVAFGEATDLFPGHLRAHVWAATTAYALLNRPRSDSEEEAEFELKHWITALEHLHPVDAQDPEDRYPDRHRIRGLLHEWRWRRLRAAESRISAERALGRYVTAMEKRGQGEADAVVEVRSRLKALQAEK